MTLDELNKARIGFSIQTDINVYRNKLSDLENDCKLIEMDMSKQVGVAHGYIDADLIVVAITEQIKRYKQKIAELEKEFDEL